MWLSVISWNAPEYVSRCADRTSYSREEFPISMALFFFQLLGLWFFFLFFSHGLPGWLILFPWLFLSCLYTLTHIRITRCHQVKVLSAWKRGMFGRGQIIRAHYDKGQLVWSSGSDREETACPFRLLTVRLRRLFQRDAIRYASQASTSCLNIS